MKRAISVLAVLGVLAALSVPVRARAEEPSQSSAAAAQLTAMLDQLKLEAFAAPDPQAKGHYVAALYIRGSQLLVVSAPYPATAALDKRIADGQYNDVYQDIQTLKNKDAHFFVVDLLADGLQRACAPEQPFDSTGIGPAPMMSFDGNWKAQQMTEADYNARFTRDDARYAEMLRVLTAALARKTS